MTKYVNLEIEHYNIYSMHFESLLKRDEKFFFKIKNLKTYVDVLVVSIGYREFVM